MFPFEIGMKIAVVTAMEGEMGMKAEIDREGCISCGLCAETCPDVFAMAEDGKAEVIVEEVPQEAEEQAQEAEEGCPVSVISVE